MTCRIPSVFFVNIHRSNSFLENINIVRKTKLYSAISGTMEISYNGWVLIAVIVGILGIGGGAIATSILQPLGQNIPFTTPITDLSTPISGEARHQFNQGIWAYREKAYIRAVDRFTKVIGHEPTLAEAFHNRARAQANLDKRQDAAADFIAASDLYSRQGSHSGINWVKTDLDVLAKL